MKPPAFSSLAPYLCKTPSLWVSCVCVCVSLGVCVTTHLCLLHLCFFFSHDYLSLFLSHLRCCALFSPTLLHSLVRPLLLLLLLLLLYCSLFLSPAAFSLKVSFTPSSAVHSLFGSRLPPGQKLYSSLCLPVRLHLRSPLSIFFLYPLSFTPFHSFFIFSLPLTIGFRTHLLKIPICTACLSVACSHLITVGVLSCRYRSEEEEKEMWRERKKTKQGTLPPHTYAHREGVEERI